MSTKGAFDGLRIRVKAYASNLIRLYASLQEHYHFSSAALVIGKQLLRSGTSVAATYSESKHTRSRADRIAKFALMLQELEESLLWLELLQDHQMASSQDLSPLLDETKQLTAIFIASIHTLKQ